MNSDRSMRSASAKALDILRVSVVSYSETLEQLSAALTSLDVAIELVGLDSFRCCPELLLVDNAGRFHEGSTESEFLAKLCRRAKFQMRVISGHGNIGYGSGHNLTITDSVDGYHLFMNPDVELFPDALQVGLKYLKKNQATSMISPSAVDFAGKKQHLNKRFPTIFDFLIRMFDTTSRRLFSKRYADYEMHDLSEELPTVGIPLASGCFMLCRNSAVLDVGGFDPEYFLYFEDFDLSMRLSKISKIAYLPDMKIKHLGGNASKKGWLHLYYFVRSGIRFFNRYGWSWFRRKRLT